MLGSAEATIMKLDYMRLLEVQRDLTVYPRVGIFQQYIG